MTVASSPPLRSRALPTALGTNGAIRLIQIEIWLLFLIPTKLRFEALGGAGHPAILFAVGLFMLWVIAVLTPSLATERRCPPVRAVLACLWFAVLVSYVVMHRSPVAADVGSAADLFLVTLLAFSGVALFAAEGIRTRDELGRVIRTVVAAAAAMSVIAIVQSRARFDLTRYVDALPGLTAYGDPNSILARGGFARPAGTATHPIEFGVVAAIVLAFAIFVALHDRVWSRSTRWGALVAIGLAIPVAVSRSGILVAACVVGAFLLGATNALRARALPVLFAFLVTVFVAFPGLLGQFRNLFTVGASDPSIATRISDYSFVETAVGAAPIVGSGPGSLQPRIRILDNQYLLTLVELGAFGLIALWGLLGAIVLLGRAGRAQSDDEEQRMLGQMLAGAGVGIALAAATFDGLSFGMFTATIALVLGIAGSYWRHARAGATAERSAQADPSDRGRSGTRRQRRRPDRPASRLPRGRRGAGVRPPAPLSRPVPHGHTPVPHRADHTT